MAELTAFGLAVNTVQFVALAVHVIKRVNDFQSSINDLPKAFRDISHQLPLMVNLCQAFKDQDADCKSPELNECLKGCIEQLSILDDLITKILPKESDSTITKTWRAIGSVKFESRILAAQRSLETYKTTMTMYYAQKTAIAGQNTIQPNVSQKKCFIFPTSTSTRFFGRKDVLKLMDNVFLSNQPGPHNPNVGVLLGLGGQGKTYIALEYCRQVGAKDHFMSILWVDATSLLTLEESFRGISAEITNHNRTFPNSNACIQFVKQTVQDRAQPWLMIFDNYDHIDRIPNIMEYTPKAAAGAVLITSRQEECGGLGTPIPISGMPEEESIGLLLQQTRLAANPENIRLAKLIVERLGYLPLAIDQSAAYIRSKKLPLSAFISHYEKRRAEMLKHTPALWDYKHINDHGSAPAPMNVYTTWELSFRQVGDNEQLEDEDSQQHFLTLLGFFNNQDIQMEMFATYHKHIQVDKHWMEIFSTENTWDPWEYQAVVANLSQLSLLQYEGGDSSRHTVSLHLLVCDWMQLRLQDQQRHKFTEEAILILETYIASSQDGRAHWSLQQTTEILCHIDACLRNYLQYLHGKTPAPSKAVSEAIITFSSFYTHNGRYVEAESILKKLIAADIPTSGKYSHQCIRAQLHLVDVFLHLSRYEEAGQLLANIEEHVQSCDQFTEVHYLTNLARRDFLLGSYEDAVENYQQVLAKQQALFPSNHRQVLAIYASLAEVYRNLGQYDEAFEIFSTTMSGYTALYSYEHPGLLETMVRLANCYRNQGMYIKAHELYQRALPGNEKYLGPDHPTTLMTMILQGVNYRNMMELDKAESCFMTAMRKMNNALGPYHDATLKAMSNLATNFSYRATEAEGEERTRLIAESETYYRLTLKGREKSLGFDSPYTMRTVERLLDLMWTQERCEEAENLADYVLHRQKRKPSFRRTSSTTLTSQTSNPSDGSSTLFEYDQYGRSKVEMIFQQAVNREEHRLCLDHPDRLEAMKSLAMVYLKQGSIKEAQQLMDQVIEGSTTRFGDTSKITNDSWAIRRAMDVSASEEMQLDLGSLEKLTLVATP